jgi:hypothetical protein
MGTSKSYTASIQGQPQWGDLSSTVTRNCNGSVVPINNITNILSNYVSVLGGASRAGRGNSRIAGRAGIRTAKNIGSFLGAFGNTGGNLQTAFTQIGLGSLGGLSLNDAVQKLLEHCTGPSSTLDDVAAKAASQKILEELSRDCETIKEWEVKLQEVLNDESLEEITERYFAYYILEHLSIMFYEKLVVEKGKPDCNSLFQQIRDFILEKIKNMNKRNPLNKIDWGSDEADRLIKNIQEDVLKVFE